MYGTVLIAGLIAVFAAAVIGAIVTSAIRKKDFNDQVSGKKPERTAGKDVRISYDKPQGENPMIAADREGLRMKSGQNLSSL